jgi:hypothetical protein
LGLALPLLSEGKASWGECLKQAWILTGRWQWRSLGWLLLDYLAFLLTAIILGVGVILGLSFILTLTFEGQRFLREEKG